MTARKAELRYLNRNIEALQTIANSSVLNQILGLVAQDMGTRVISIPEFMRMNEAFNKLDNAITELNHLVHNMNGTDAEPEPHGSRDTFVPKTVSPFLSGEKSCLPNGQVVDGPEEEQYNAMQD